VHAQFRVLTLLQLHVENLMSYLNSVKSFSCIDTVISSTRTVFGDYCDNNVCACAVSALVLLSFVNLSPEMDSATLISYTTEKV